MLWLFPQRCVSCQDYIARDHVVCATCSRTLSTPGETTCERCALPLEYAWKECATCEEHMPSFDRLVAFWRYEGAMVDALRGAKDRGALWAARSLTRAAHPRFRAWADDHHFDGVTWIPAQKARLRERGFHLPALVARWWVPSARAVMISRRDRTRQADLPAAMRRTNIDDAFEASSEIRGHWLIVDDIATTCSTLSGAAAVLRGAGADEVSCAVLARTPLYASDHGLW